MANMQKVASSNISEVGWENSILYVQFSNALYSYKAVPENVYTRFLTAQSKGSFFAKEIKGKYEFTKEG
jgi:hypothetical protein